MKNNRYYFYLTNTERSHLIKTLFKARNALIEQERYTDAVDDVTQILCSAKLKRVKIKYK